jgi:hypothetical protein
MEMESLSTEKIKTNRKLKSLIQAFYPSTTPIQMGQKEFLIQHLDQMSIPMYEDQIKKLEKVLNDAKEGNLHPLEILKKGRGIKQLWERREQFQQAVLSLPSSTPHQKNIITFLYSINYPHQRFRDQETKAIVETFIRHPTMMNAQEVEKRFRQQQQQQQKQQQQRKQNESDMVERLLDEYFATYVKR